MQLKFEFPEKGTLAKSVIDSIIRKIVRSHRHRLKIKYFSNIKKLTEQQALNLRPLTITENDWIALVHETPYDERYCSRPFTYEKYDNFPVRSWSAYQTVISCNVASRASFMGELDTTSVHFILGTYILWIEA